MKSLWFSPSRTQNRRRAIEDGEVPSPDATYAPDVPHPFEGHEADLPTQRRRLMTLAVAQATQALDHGDVPVGALVVVDGEIVAARHNERELTGDPTAHAEVLALRDAAAEVGDRRLRGATLVVTLEPCPMCAGAIWAAQVGTVVYGAPDPKAGAMGSLYNLAADPRLNHTTKVIAGVEAHQSADLLRAFFAERR